MVLDFAEIFGCYVNKNFSGVHVMDGDFRGLDQLAKEEETQRNVFRP